LEKHPSYTSARVVLGRIYQEKNRIDEATNEFKKVLELDPENLMAHSLLGSIFMEKKDYQTAIEEFQKILTLNPDDDETQTHLKQAIEKAASEQKPQKPLKKEEPVDEKKSKPRESTASITIAELYLKQGHFDKAIEIFQELLAEDPQNLMLRQKLSEAVERQQKEGSVDPSAHKLKKNQFTQPPDVKEDIIQDEAKQESKQKVKSGDDSKFTNEDILQVMRRGGKDDAMLEEKKIKPVVVKSEPVVEAKKSAPPEPPQNSNKISSEQFDNLKGVLAELSGLSGIIKCLVSGRDGIPIVSMGETSNNADLAKQVSAIFESTRRSVSQLNQGKLQQVLVTAEIGNILLVSFSDYVLIVLANNKINLGLLRLALDSATKKLDKLF